MSEHRDLDPFAGNPRDVWADYERFNRDEWAAHLDENPPRPRPVWRGVYPGMCIDPEICRGHTSCPRDRSCSE